MKKFILTQVIILLFVLGNLFAQREVKVYYQVDSVIKCNLLEINSNSILVEKNSVLKKIDIKNLKQINVRKNKDYRFGATVIGAIIGALPGLFIATKENNSSYNTTQSNTYLSELMKPKPTFFPILASIGGGFAGAFIGYGIGNEISIIKIPIKNNSISEKQLERIKSFELIYFSLKNTKIGTPVKLKCFLNWFSKKFR